VWLQIYIHPITLLERINYDDPEGELPVNHLLRKTQFKIGTLNKHTEWHGNYNWNRKDFIPNIVEHYKSFVIACDKVDSSAMIYYLVNSARQRAAVNANAPIPVFLDVGNWPTDISWTDWLHREVSFSNTPIEDIASGKCAIYACGLEYPLFKNHPLKSSFEEWLYGTSPPRSFIVVCTYLSNLDDYLSTDMIIVPVEIDVSQFQQICTAYSDRPFGQFIVRSLENKSLIPAIDYLIQNPVLAATFLSVKFNAAINFEQLDVSEYFQTLIDNLWYIATCRDYEDQIDFAEIENSLTRLAALATEQQKVSFSYNNLLSLISSKSAITKSIDAAFLSISDNMIRFSMPMIQGYFAAKALVQFGIPDQLPKLVLDKQFRRLPQRWDNPIIISSHLSNHKDAMLKHIANSDPILALLCITTGLPISSSLYSFVIEQNLNTFTTLGDIRVDFATHLHRIDPKVAKAIFVEILRDAHWPIRVNAFVAFTELEKSLLPGLTEAITNLEDSTRNQVTQALHRLGTDALSTLFGLLRKDNAKLRSNAAWALGELRDKASVPALVEALRDNDLGVSKQVVASLELLQDINCVPYLVQYLNIRHVRMRKAISGTLTRLQNSMPEKFASQVHKMDATAKRSVVQIFHGFVSDKLVDFLLELSHDENVEVQLAAIEELGSHPETRVISRLEDCLDDMTKSRSTKSTVSEIVSKVLSNIQKTDPKTPVLINYGNTIDTANHKSLKSSDIVKARLLQVKETRPKEQNVNYEVSDKMLIKDDKINASQNGVGTAIADDSYVSSILKQLRERTWISSSNAARILREYVKEQHGNASLNVINQILETLNDSDWMIRWTGVETLGWTGNVHVVPHLVQRLTDNNWKIRIAAIRSLSEIGDNAAVTGLSALLSDNNSVVREAAAEALGLLDGKETLQALESAATDPEDFVRLAAVESLGRLHQKSAVRILLSALRDKSEHVRWAAANGLSGMVSAEMVSSLVPSLSDTAGPYWEQKRICDVIVDILKQIGSDEALSAIADWGNSQA
jgi:HEAT repeat protein